MPEPDLSPRLGEILAAHEGLEGPLLPILHAVQAEWGHVPRAALAPIAAALNVTVAEVWGVVSFYHDFRERPAGRRVLRLCRAEACQATGGQAVAAGVLDRLGVDWGGTSADGGVTVEAVYCLGLCAAGPAALVDGRPLARVTAEALCAEVGR